MIDQSGVLLNNRLLGMQETDVANMVVRIESGGALMGALLRPGQSLSMVRAGPGDDTHNLIAAGSRGDARLAFRVKNAAGEVVREAGRHPVNDSAQGAGDTIYSAIHESKGSTRNWTYEVVNLDRTGEPVYVTLLLTRTDSGGTSFVVSDMTDAIQDLAKQVQEMGKDDWGVMPGQVSLVGGMVAAGSSMGVGPFNMLRDTFVQASSDKKSSDWELSFLRAASGAVVAKDTDSRRRPYALVSGHRDVNILLKNAGKANSFGCYALMRSP